MPGPHHAHPVAVRTGVGARTEKALVVGLIALGAALRIQGVASHPLWIDEHGTWWAVAGQGLGELWHRVTSVHGQSPLYYAIVDLCVGALGPTPLALRLPSLCFGIGLLGLAVPLARATLGSRFAVAALAAFAVNERLIFYSQEARPYALALFCAGLSCLAWLALLREPRSSRVRTAYLLTTAACFYAHYLFGLLILVQAAHWLVHLALGPRERPLRAELRPWLPTVTILVVLLLPAAPQLADLFARRALLDWVRPTSPLHLLGIYFDTRVLAWTTGAVLLALLATRRLTLPSRPSGASLVALWLALPFAAIALLPPLLGISLSDRRYVAVALPAVPLLYGLGMTLPARVSRLAWLPLVVFLAASASLALAPRYQASGLFSDRYRSEPWERAVSSLLRAHQPGEPIFYATHFVELDAVAQDRASPEAREFSAWPVAAYLPPEHIGSLRALPYDDSPELAPVFQARLEEAARMPRSWVIGKQPVIAHFIRLARQHPQVRVVAHQRFGRLYLIQLRGRGEARRAGDDPDSLSGAR